MKILCFFAIMLSIFQTSANGLRVDIDYPSPGRTDMYTHRWINWAPASAASIDSTFNGITVTFRNGGSSGSGVKCGWYKGLLTNGATLTTDGIIIDETTTGGTLEMELSGLSPGTHSLVTWHSFFDNVSGSTMEISVDGSVKLKGIKVPTRVTNDENATRVYFTFEAHEGKSTVIKFRPEGNGTFDNVVLNAFEIDGSDPAKKISNCKPSEGNEHYPVENGLNWKAASGAISHDIYLGEDSSAVDNATEASPEFRGNQTTVKYQLSSLSPFKLYWWRVDEKFSGSSQKGDVIPFRIQRLAFPTAEGYGRFAQGGRGGRVIEITNLNDAGEGSLRNAIEVEKGPRTIIFRVGGVIALNSKLVIPADGGNVYVAGQTAPGDGICITRYAFGMLADDVIIRHIRTRVGDYCKQSMDGMGMSSSDNSIIDHCSISWAIDEGHSSRGARNITFQRNIISEALNNSYHYNADDRTKTEPHSFAASIGGHYGSYLHNLHAHCTGRNWSLAGGLEQDAKTYAGYVEIVNNVIYNWRDRTTDGGVRQCNFVNNFYKAGPSSILMQLVSIDGDELKTGDMQKAYITGNKMINTSGGVLLNPSSDNWSLCISKFNTVAQVKSGSPLFPVSVTPLTADAAYTDVLSNVGATKPKQDPIDTRIVKEVKNGSYTYTGSKDKLKGIIDSQNDVGGYPSMSGGVAPKDSDHDGMPDEWESKYGLNPNNAEDRNYSNLSSDQYTNLEMYLNELAGDPVRFSATPVSANNLRGHAQKVEVSGKRITISLVSKALISVYRVNLLGTKVGTVFNGCLPEGTSLIPFEKPRNLASGITFLKIKGPDINFTFLESPIK